MRRSPGPVLLALALMSAVSLSPLALQADRAVPPAHRIGLVVEPGDVVQEGGGVEPVNAEMVMRMVGARRAAFVACYERALPGAPSLRGHIVLAVTVTTAGTTTAVVREKTLASDAVADCAVRVANGFRFNPPPSGAVTFAVRLRYEPTAVTPF